MARTKKQQKVKELIKIKFKPLVNGNKSIFLEKYEGYKIVDSGTSAKRSLEYLHLYLIPETTAAAKKANAITLQLANTIKAQRIVEQQEKDTSLTVRKNIKVNLIEFVDEIADKSFADTGNKRSEYYTFKSLSHHLKAFRGNDVNINEVDKAFINGFIDYLKTAKNGNYKVTTKKKAKTQNHTIAKNTAHKLFAKFSTVIKKALQDEIISTNPMQKIDDKVKPKTTPSKREYLTIDELKTLIDTDCRRPVIKNAFLFCCLVGIRFENVRNITFADLKTNSKKETVLSYKQIKVDTFETLPLSNEALKFVPTQTNPDDKIFVLPKTDTVNDIIREWVTAAEINKKITFHCSRHTAATLQLSLGTPIETVSKLLGHGKIATTQIYAKIINQSKVDAVDKQNGIFN